MTRVMLKRYKGNTGMFYEAIFSPTYMCYFDCTSFMSFIDFGTPFVRFPRASREVPAKLLKRKSDVMITRSLKELLISKLIEEFHA